MKKNWRRLITLFLVIVLSFGIAAPTVAYAAEALPEQNTENTPTEGGTVDLDWFLLEYDKDSLTVTLYQEIKSLLETDRADVELLMSELVEALKLIVLEDIEKGYVDDQYGDVTDDGDSEGIDITNVWNTAIDRYIDGLPESVVPAGDEEPYMSFFKAAVKDDGNTLMSDFIDYACNLVKLAYKAGYISLEELESHDKADIDSKIDSIINDKIDKALKTKVQGYADSYIAWILGDSNELAIDPDVVALIDSKVSDYALEIKGKYLAGTLDPSLSDEAAFLEYADKEVAEARDKIIKDAVIAEIKERYPQYTEVEIEAEYDANKDEIMAELEEAGELDNVDSDAIADAVNEKITEATAVEYVHEVLLHYHFDEPDTTMYEAVKVAINDKVHELTDHIDMSAEPVAGDMRDEAFRISLGIGHAEFNAQVDAYVDELAEDYAATVADLEGIDQTLEYEEIIQLLSSVTVKGHVIYGPDEDGVNYINREGIEELIRELPRPSELRNYTLDEMCWSFPIVVNTTVGKSAFELTLKVGSGDDKVRKLAGLIADYTDISFSGTTVNVALRVPARATDLLLRACNSTSVDNSLKLKLFSMMGGSFGEMYSELRALSFGEIKDILTSNYDFVRNSEYINSIIDVKNLSDNEINAKLDKLEPYFDKLLDYADRVYGYVPDSVKNKSVADMYNGSGNFSASGTKTVSLDDVERALVKINETWGYRIAAQLPEFEKTLTVNVSLDTSDVYKVTYKTDTTERVGFLPVGADIDFFADMEEYDGARIEGWSDGSAVIYTMPARDVVLTPELEVLLPDVIEWDYDPDAPFIYDGNDKRVELKTALDENRVTVTYSGNESSELGKHTATAIITTKSGKLLAELTLEWWINLPTEDITWNYNSESPFVYKGSAYTVELLNVDGDKYSVDYDGITSATDKGEYTATATVTFKNGGELLGTYELTWNIAPLALSLSWDRENFTYTPNTEQGPVLVGFPENMPVGWSVEYVEDDTYVAKAENAGSYKSKAIVTVTSENYSVANSERTHEWKIDKAVIDTNSIYFHDKSVSAEEITAPIAGPELTGVALHPDRDKFEWAYFKDSECTDPVGEGFTVYGDHTVYVRISVKSEYADNYRLGTSGGESVQIWDAHLFLKTAERLDYVGGKLNTKVELKDGYLENDHHLGVDPVNKVTGSEGKDNLLPSTSVPGGYVDVLKTLDIYFYDNDGYGIGIVGGSSLFTVTILLENYTGDVDDLFVVYLTDRVIGGKTVYEIDTVYSVETEWVGSDLYVTFETDHFSTYAIAQDYVAPTVPSGIMLTEDSFVYDGERHDVELDWNYDESVFRVEYVDSEDFKYYATEIGNYEFCAEIYDAREGSLLATVSRSWSITDVPYVKPTLNWTGTTFYYDGLNKTVEVILPQGFELLGYTDNVKSEAGAYTATAIVRDINADVVFDVTLAWQIVMPTVDFTWNYSAPFTYNGAQQSVGLADYDADRFTVSYVGNTAQNAGTYNAVATVKFKSSGVTFKTVELTWQIEKYTVNLSEVAWSYTPGVTGFVYAPNTTYNVTLTGLPAHFPMSLVTYKTGNGYATSVSDAGTYVASAVIGTNSNYLLTGTAPADITWTVAPFEIDLSLVHWDYTADTKFVYAPNTTYSVKIVGLPEGFPEELVVYKTAEGYATSATGAGTYLAGVTVNLNSNYVIKDGTFAPTDLTWTVEKATIDLTGVSLRSLTVVADGKTYSLELTGLTEEILLLLDVAYTGNSASLPGIHTVTATFTPKDTANYKTPDAKVAYIYIKASSYKYPEDALTDFEVEVSLSDGKSSFDAGIDFGVENKTDSYASGITYKDTEGNDIPYNVLVAYDINFLKNGQVTSLGGDSVTVKLKIPAAYLSRAALAIAHIAEDGTVELIDSERSSGYLVFNTTHFSVYAIVAPVSTAEEPPAEDFDILPIIIIAAIILLLIIAIIIFVIVRRKGKDDEPPTEEAAEPAPTAPDEPETVEEAVTEEEPIEEPEAEEPTEEPAVEEPAVEEPAVEAPAEEAPEETAAEPAPAAEQIVPIVLESQGDDSLKAIIGGEVVMIRYRSSFMSRLIQSDADIQSYYTVIKNKLMSFEGVKARTSWNFESFNRARLQLAKLNVKGKALLLYLNLDTEQYNATKYHFQNVGDKPKFADVPMLLKVKSDRGLKYALELIDELMRTYDISALESAPDTDYAMPYESTEALAARGLVKIILPKGMSLADGANMVKIDVGELLSGIEPKTKETVEEPEIVEEPEVVEESLPLAEPEVTEEPVEEAPKEPEEEPVAKEAPAHEERIVPLVLESAGNDSLKAIIDGESVMIRYRSSFTSRLIQSEEDVQTYYTVLKNKLLSFKGVKARTSWNFESFNKGRLQLAKLNVKGKALLLYLNLDTEKYNANKYHFQNVGDKPKFADVTMLLKVKSDRGLRYALELIDELMTTYEIEALKKAPDVDYRMPYESTEVLAERGLVKIILPKGMSLADGVSTVKIDVTELISANDNSAEKTAPVAEPEVTEEPIEEAPAEPEVTEEPAVAEEPPHEEFVHTDAVHADEMLTDEEAEAAIEHIHNGASKRTGKLAEVNLDVICENFEDGDVVDIDALKEKHLVSRKAGRIKVLARGVMTKSLTVIAAKFSLQAVKMITLAGGHADEED